MASSSYSAPSPPSFTGENYPIWAVKMKAYLRAFDLWEVVETGGQPAPLPQNPTIAQMKQHREEVAKEYKALVAIHSSLTDEIFARIMHYETAKLAWDKLKEEFQGSDRTRQMQMLNLRREFELLRMKESETIKEFVDRLMKIVNQLRLLGEQLTEQRIVDKVLISVPERFESKISSLELVKDLSQLTVTEVVSAFQGLEQRRALRQDESIEGAFQAKLKEKQASSSGGKKQSGEKKDKEKKMGDSSKGTAGKGKYPTCPHCKKRSHSEKFCWFRPNVRCRACNQLGHVEKVCKNKGNQQGQQAQVAENYEQGEEKLFAATCYVANSGKNTWLIDSGCTSHMTHDASIFKELDDTYISKVKIGNGEYVDVKGKGVVAVETPSGIKLIDDVLFVPNISQNLLSVAQMLERHYTLHFQDMSCIIFDPTGCELMTVEMKDKSFPVEWKQVSNHANSCVEDDSVLWHKRLGHFSYSTLKHMHSSELVLNLPAIGDNVEVCDVCQYGKQTKLPFSDSTWKASEKLQLIHSDVCGPMSISSLNGSRYFLLFIDDFSRWCWVYFLKQKSEVLDVFKKFKAMVEKQTGCHIKILRSDNGTEYTSREFKAFCEQEGIQHQFTVPYTPQQNGVSERKNRSIMEMGRCLLFEKGLPKSFWAEAVNTSVYLLNLLPTRILKGRTPYEVWHETKPSVEHLKIFGCVCYAHVADEKRTKLDEKAEAGIFLGYSSNTKGYRIYSLKTKKILVSRNVKFDEFSKWNWDRNEVERSDKSHIGGNIFQKQDAAEVEIDEDNYDDIPIRGTLPLEEIYERCNIASLEPKGYKEAASKNDWEVAMQEEMNMIEKNRTWTLVDKPQNHKVLGVKWVYRTKLNPDGSVNKLKARLVVKGYFQQHGVDFSETFAPVARHDTIRLLVALAAKLGWKIYHLDVKSAFLNGLLEEDIFVEQPEGFLVLGSEDKVYKLHKALYGLKQAPRAWYSRIDSYLLQQGFKRSESEATLYVKKAGTEVDLIVSLYVDDLLVTGGDSNSLKQFKLNMEQEFEMSDLGEMMYFLGMEIEQCDAGIFISQKKYAWELLKKFHMERSKPVSTPLVVNQKLSNYDEDSKADDSLYRSIIGSLLYLSATRPDVMFSASLLSRFMHSPSQVHMGVAKRVLRYIRGTTDYGLWYLKDESNKLEGYADSDHGGSVDDAKSTSGYCFSFGSDVFSWNSKKQEVVAQSTAEAEYMSAAGAANQAIWLRKILADLEQHQNEATTIWVDNKSAIAIAKNPVQHGRTKHINIKFHAVREYERLGEVNLVHCSSENQIADIMTKALPRARFELLRAKLGVFKKNLKEEC